MILEELFVKCCYKFGRNRLNFDVSVLTQEDWDELYKIHEEANKKNIELIKRGIHQ